jgi:hypothetical protein
MATVAVILSAITFALAQRFSQAADRRSRLPVLVFTYDPGGHWLLRNVGNGPALNIIIALKMDHADFDWQQPTRIPPISRDGEFKLAWLDNSDLAVIAASYEDFLVADTLRQSREYTVTMKYDTNRVVPRRELPRWDVTDSMAHWQRHPPSHPGPLAKVQLKSSEVWRALRLHH